MKDILLVELRILVYFVSCYNYEVLLSMFMCFEIIFGINDSLCVVELVLL